MQEFFTTLFEKLAEFASTAGLRLLSALAVVIVGFKLCSWIIKAIKKSAGFSKLDAGVQSFVGSFLSIALKILFLLTAAAILGVPMTNFVAILSSCGLAIGLALQGSLSNLAGGIMILIFKPFKIGDYIETAAGSGTVAEVTILYTILNTPDNRRVVIPNGAISNDAITNYSYHETRRVDIPVSVAYHSDIETVKTLLLEQAHAHPLVLDDPAPFCRLSEHGDSSLNFVLRVWVESKDYWTVSFDLKESAKQTLDRNGIEIPFPQLDVHLDQQSSQK